MASDQSDTITELRQACWWCVCCQDCERLMHQAADELEASRQWKQDKDEELERLRAIVAGCHAAIGECDGSDSESLPETIGQIVSDLRERVEQQRAIVALLPQSTDGTTVVPNEHYWVRTGPHTVKMVLIVSIERTPGGWWCNDSHGEGYTPGDDLYGTREAAEQKGQTS